MAGELSRRRAGGRDSLTAIMKPWTLGAPSCKWLQWTVAALLSCAAGCAHTTVTKVKPGDYATEGARYWLPAPYLLVTAPVVLSKEESVVAFNPLKKELTDASYVVARAGAPGRPPLPTNEGDFESKPPAAPLRARAKAALTKAKQDKPASPFEASPPEAPEPIVERLENPSNSPAITVVWLPDYCEGFAANRQGLFTNEPLRVALGDGWRLEAIDSAIKAAPLAVKPAALTLPAPGPAESDGRRTSAKGRKSPEQAEPGTIRFFKRVTTMAVKPGLYRVFTRSSCDKEPALSEDILKASLQSVHFEELR
jgi:hypothetical protein